MNIGVASEIYDAGLTEDGEQFTAERYFIAREEPDGSRYIYNGPTYAGCVRHECEGAIWFEDVREAAAAKASAKATELRLKDFDESEWYECEPAYGSTAYCRMSGF